MALKKLVAFRFDPELIEGLEAVKRRLGTPISEQVRRAVQAWLLSQSKVRYGKVRHKIQSGRERKRTKR